MTGKTLTDLELDELVATKVMWETKPLYLLSFDRHFLSLADSREVGGSGNWLATTTGYDDGDRLVWIPRPFSTSIADAWAVVERMAERRMEVCLTYTDDRRATAIFALMEPVGIAEDDAMSRAICLAALRAVGEDV